MAGHLHEPSVVRAGQTKAHCEDGVRAMARSSLSWQYLERVSRMWKTGFEVLTRQYKRYGFADDRIAVVHLLR